MKKWIRALLIGGTALLLVLTFISHRRLSTTRRGNVVGLGAEARRQEKAKRIAQWLSQPVIPLVSPTLDEAVAVCLAKEACMKEPVSVESVPVDKLSEAQVRDLKLAVSGLLRAYATEDPEMVFDYMTARNERLREDARSSTIEDLIGKYGMNKAEIDAADDKKLFRLIWTSERWRSHWQNLIKDSCCVRLWKTKKALDERLALLGADENSVFQNMVSHRHNFEPVGSSLSIAFEKGEVIFADVKVVIQYDNARLNEPRPHYFRFWFDSSQGIWRLQNVVLIPTIDGTYPAVWF